MRTIRAIVLTISLLLLVCGCTASWQAERASLGADPGQEPPARDTISSEPKDRPANACLEGHGFTILSFRAIRDSFGGCL